MNTNGPISLQSRSGFPPRHGFTESFTENMLRDSVLIATALTGVAAALVLQDERGPSYRDGSGLSSEQLECVEQGLALGFEGEVGNRLLQEHGLLVLESLPLTDECHRVVGALCLLSPNPLKLSDTQSGVMSLLADHIQTIVSMDHQKIESRTTPRPPSASSFVPGLVHELGSFLFGISANLDAFEARFADMDEVSKYGTKIRRTLDRMSAFIVELREYGDPQVLSWSSLKLEPLLREAIRKALPLAVKNQVDLQLMVEGALPLIPGDEEVLLATFGRLVELVLQHAEADDRLILRVAASQQGQRCMVLGHFDFSKRECNGVDPARLFEPFYFRVAGLGRLTLPGARRVFESHGGTLTAGPGPEGGMRISFVLPSESAYPLQTVDQT